MKNSITTLLIFFHFALTAQEKIRITLHFPSDVAELRGKQAQRLDSVISTLSNTKSAYKVLLSGHTDNEGELQYNQALSEKRARAVRQKLIRRGFDPDLISYSAHAYLKPVSGNDHEEGKSRNRRVQAEFILVKQDPAKALEITPATAKYKIQAGTETVLQYTSGTQIRIPAGAFVHNDLSAVKGEVEVRYTEYRNICDFIGSNIPMNFCDRSSEMVQFNSAGMFRMEVYQDNRKLQLKEGKYIDVSFQKTGLVPEMEIFQLNAKNNTWSQPITEQVSTVASRYVIRGKPVAGDYFNSCAAVLEGKDVCLLNLAEATRHAIRTGHRLASGKSPVYLKRSRLAFSSNWKGEIPSYRVEVSRKNDSQVKFRLVPAGRANPRLDFSQFEWIYSSNEKYPWNERWEQGLWLRMKLEYLTEKDFYLTLYRNEEELRLSVRGKLDNGYLTKTELKVFYENNSASNVRLMLDKKSRDEDFANVIWNSPERRLREDLCGDSLYCFYTGSKQWMDTLTGEDTLCFRSWLDYFNANKTLMKERYDQLYEKRDSVINFAREKLLRRYLEQAKQRWELAGSDMPVSSELTETMRIYGLGIYNCDQIKRLEEPVIVQKQFRCEKGNNLDLVTLFVINNTVNGVLRYDGSYDYSPYRFAISRLARNTLLALDRDENIYVCKPEALRAAIENNKGMIVMQQINKEQFHKEFTSW